MLSHSPARIAGNDSATVGRSKKDDRTRGHPGEDAIAHPAATANTKVDRMATPVDRRARDRL